MMMDNEEIAQSIEMLKEELHYIQWERERLDADSKEIFGRIYELEQILDARTEVPYE